MIRSSVILRRLNIEVRMSFHIHRSGVHHSSSRREVRGVVKAPARPGTFVQPVRSASHVARPVEYNERQLLVTERTLYYTATVHTRQRRLVCGGVLS
jgi:hypothetical protein